MVFPIRWSIPIPTMILGVPLRVQTVVPTKAIVVVRSNSSTLITMRFLPTIVQFRCLHCSRHVGVLWRRIRHCLVYTLAFLGTFGLDSSFGHLFSFLGCIVRLGCHARLLRCRNCCRCRRYDRSRTRGYFVCIDSCCTRVFVFASSSSFFLWWWYCRLFCCREFITIGSKCRILHRVRFNAS